MALTREEAAALLHEWTEGEPLRNHALAVEASMRAAAHRYGRGAEDEANWAVAGLIHDADYERWPEEHPARVVAWLRDRGEGETADAVAGHYTRWGVPNETPMSKALLACDELTGFIVACGLVRPEGIRSLAPSSVKKKLKDKGFAAKVDRDEVRTGVELLGADLDDHIRMIVEALQPLADRLGVAGKPTV